MNNKAILLVIVSLLILTSIYFAFFRNNTEYNEKMEIVLEDTASISKIQISDGKLSVEINKINDKWLVNNVYNANDILIKRILRIFKNLEINTLLPETEHDSISKNLENKGISICFFNESTQYATYWIGKYDDTKKSTLLMNDDKLPVFATAPGLTSDISKFVEVDPLFWRNKRIFDFEANEINQIDFIDNENISNSFYIHIQNSDFQVSDINHRDFEFDNDKVSRYLSYFKNIEFESVAKELSSLNSDSIIKLKPKYIIKVKSVSGNYFELKLIPILIKNRQQEFDLNKIYGILNNKKPIVMINYFAVDPLIKQISYFKNEN